MCVVRFCYGHKMRVNRSGGTESAVRCFDVQFKAFFTPDLREIRPDGENDRQVAAKHIFDPLPELSAGHTPQRRYFYAVQAEKDAQAPGEHKTVESPFGDQRKKAAVQLCQ